MTLGRSLASPWSLAPIFPPPGPQGVPSGERNGWGRTFPRGWTGALAAGPRGPPRVAAAAQCAQTSPGAVRGALRKTHEFLCARKVKELHQPEVISRDDVEARVGHARAVNVSLVCVPRPDADDLVSQDAVPGDRCEESRRLQPGSGQEGPVALRPLPVPALALPALRPGPFHPGGKLPPSPSPSSLWSPVCEGGVGTPSSSGLAALSLELARHRSFPSPWAGPALPFPRWLGGSEGLARAGRWALAGAAQLEHTPTGCGFSFRSGHTPEFWVHSRLGQ